MFENDIGIMSKKEILNGFSVSRIIYGADEIENADGYLADICIPRNRSGTQEQAYEIYRDIIERTLGTPITVIIDLDITYEEKLRAILLAAVYGRVSLLIRNIVSIGEINLALQIFHKVFCQLETEGKEFNGYIKIGLSVDTPCILLEDLTSISRIDFFTVNVERLITLMCGGKKNTPTEATDIVCKYINNFCKIHPSKSISIYVGDRSLSNSFLKMYRENNISQLFC